MCNQKTYEDLLRFIFSPVSASGPTRFALPGGLTIAQSGPQVVRANLSARQAKAQGLLTSGTYGPPHIGLSASEILSSSLANSLQAVTARNGSTLYKLTWKPWVMPSGRLRFRLRASARPTSVIVRIGWPTPTAQAYRGASHSGREGGLNLQTAAQLGTWPTPSATDGKGGYQGGRIRNGKLSTDRLDVVAQLMGSGPMPNGSPAGTVNIGQLNPALPLWLMGLPNEWDVFEPTETQ